MLLKTYQNTIDLLTLHHQDAVNFPYLLESAAHGHTWTLGKSQEFVQLKNPLGRYSILFAYPQESLVLDEHFKLHYSRELESNRFLDALDEIVDQGQFKAYKTIQNEQASDLPFTGGWFLYLGYELAQEIEPTLELPASTKSMPVAFATRIPSAVIVDHELECMHVVTENNFLEFSSLCEQVENLIEKIVPLDCSNKLEVTQLKEEDPKVYIDAIERTHQYIRDGDIFQANLSREWKAELDSSITAVYQKLRLSNPGPFAGLAVYHDGFNDSKHAIISSSPERLICIKSDRVDARPIAGTRPRIQSDKYNDDEIVRQELIKHPKERAEHVMLIDLVRNDIGRICQYGSVHVDELMVIESYEHVHHIVSNVTGTKRHDVTAGQAIKAVFPGGTITGCPKVRCMEIIAELEQTPREAYTGSMGYLNHNGDMDLNILIRTIQMHVDRNGKHLKFRAGGGIVYDSDAEKEVHETRAKARGLLKALQG